MLALYECVSSVSEISKKQRKIFEDFEIDIKQLFGY